MLKKTIEVNGTRVTVRTRFRKTPIMEAQYDRWLRAHYPAYAAFKFPSLSSDVLDDDNEPSMAAKIEVGTAIEANREGFELRNSAQDFLPLAARICEASGDFHVNGTGRFEEDALIAAFEHMLNGDDGEDDLWTQIRAAIEELDTPLVPEHKQEGAAESSDPLSVVLIDNGSSKSKG